MALYIANFKLYWANPPENVQQQVNLPVAASLKLLFSRSSVFTDTVTSTAASPSSTRARVTYPASSSTLYSSSSYRTVTPKGECELKGKMWCSTRVHTYIKAKMLELLLMYTVHVSMYYGNLISINSIISLIKCSGTLTHMRLKKVIKLNGNYGLLMRIFCETGELYSLQIKNYLY